MLDILTARPSPGSWRHEPMTIAEIDAHPDADRIWSTVRAMQRDTQDMYDDGYHDGEKGAQEDVVVAESDAREACAKDLRAALDDLVDDLPTKAELVLEALADKWS